MPQSYGGRGGAETLGAKGVAHEGETVLWRDVAIEVIPRPIKAKPALTAIAYEPTEVGLARWVLKGDGVPTCSKKGEGPFHPIILRAANRYRVDSALIKAIIMAESSYNPKAISKRGARGLMQLMPKTAQALGVGDSFDPEHNINAGVKHFRNLLNQFNGDVRLALAAYNAGSGKVREYQGVPPFKATRYYIKKVFEYHEYYKKQVAW
jgi:soluble lytic murein transglycosylase-like protein